jgi:hypothetical protein
MTPEEAKAAVVKKDEPEQQRAGKGVLKFDRYSEKYKCRKKNIMIKLNIILFSINMRTTRAAAINTFN